MNEIEDTNKQEDIPCYKWEEYCLIVHTTHSDLECQCNFYQHSNGIFLRKTKNILNFVWYHRKPQRTYNLEEQQN